MGQPDFAPCALTVTKVNRYSETRTNLLDKFSHRSSGMIYQMTIQKQEASAQQEAQALCEFVPRVLTLHDLFACAMLVWTVISITQKRRDKRTPVFGGAEPKEQLPRPCPRHKTRRHAVTVLTFQFHSIHPHHRRIIRSSSFPAITSTAAPSATPRLTHAAPPLLTSPQRPHTINILN